jgi:O-methyltransferase involved in polyketide biosynthesis
VPCRFGHKIIVSTILNLGAGLDTRPYRMELPESLRWIEVDHPHVIELKEASLSGETPRCRLERVKLDLADVDARRTLLDEVAAQSKKILVTLALFYSNRTIQRIGWLR